MISKVEIDSAFYRAYILKEDNNERQLRYFINYFYNVIFKNVIYKNIYEKKS